MSSNSQLWQERTDYQSMFALLDDANASALIVEVNGYIWIEFLGDGNAGCIYRASDCRFTLDSSRFSGSTAAYGLKCCFPPERRHLAQVRTIHKGNWQPDLAYGLSRVGIYLSRD